MSHHITTSRASYRRRRVFHEVEIKDADDVEMFQDIEKAAVISSQNNNRYLAVTIC